MSGNYIDIIDTPTAARALISDEYDPLIDSNGDLLFSLGVSIQRTDNQFDIGDFLGGINGSDGLITLFSGNHFNVEQYLQGGILASGFPVGYARVGNFIEFETWYRHTADGLGGIRARINGCQIEPDTTYSAPNVLERYSEAYLLTRDGTNQPQTGMTVETLRIRTNDPNAFYAEGGIIGDSTVAENVVPMGTAEEQAAIGTLIYTFSESKDRLGIYSVAHAGDDIATQKSAFQASPLNGHDLRWCVMQVGINDVLAASDPADIIDDLQDLVDTVQASSPGVTIFVCLLDPADAYFTAHSITDGSTTRAAVNTAIADGTITGIVPVTSHIGILDSTTPGTLDAAYDTGDGLHPNLAGRQIVAHAIRQQLVSEGMLMATTGYVLTDTSHSFTPTVNVSGGDTAPEYSTNTGRYTRLANQCFVDVYLTGDGGDEGSGTNQITIDLPIVASSDHPTSLFVCGYALNNTTEYIPLWGQVAGGATAISLFYESGANATSIFTPDLQNNATRTIRLKFFYEI